MSAHFTALAERGEMLPGVLPREAWCRRMSAHFQGAVEHGGPPSPNRLVGSHV